MDVPADCIWASFVHRCTLSTRLLLETKAHLRAWPFVYVCMCFHVCMCMHAGLSVSMFVWDDSIAVGDYVKGSSMAIYSAGYC